MEPKSLKPAIENFAKLVKEEYPSGGITARESALAIMTITAICEALDQSKVEPIINAAVEGSNVE